jgi:hypothetical protein
MCVCVCVYVLVYSRPKLFQHNLIRVRIYLIGWTALDLPRPIGMIWSEPAPACNLCAELARHQLSSSLVRKLQQYTASS